MKLVEMEAEMRSLLDAPAPAVLTLYRADGEALVSPVWFRVFTPTSASWMNQIETWFGILTRQAIRRGSFENVRVLTAAIERFTRDWNAGASPFTWVKSTDEILAKAVRKTQADSGARH